MKQIIALAVYCILAYENKIYLSTKGWENKQPSGKSKTDDVSPNIICQ